MTCKHTSTHTGLEGNDLVTRCNNPRCAEAVHLVHDRTDQDVDLYNNPARLLRELGIPES